MPPLTDAAALHAWRDDAQYAVDLGHTLTPSMLLALTSTPEQPGDPTVARTWYLEEYERVFRAKLQTPFPSHGDALAVEHWRTLQDERAATLEGLLARHAEAVALARAFVDAPSRVAIVAGRVVYLDVAPKPVKRRTPRRTMVDHALAVVGNT